MCSRIWYILYIKKEGRWVPENACTDKQLIKKWRKKISKFNRTKIKRVKGY